ncbi:MAG: PAS domain S-box protein, partial [Dehalococcoidia bacterium]
SALHGGKSYNIDFRLLLPNGEVRAVHEEGVVLLDKSGNPIHASGTVQDITERKRVEEKLAESERLYSSMANSSPIGVYIIQDGKFTFANQKFCDMTGFSRNELSDMEPWSLVHPKDREMVRVNAVRMLKGRSSVAYEYRAIIKNGETRVILETVASIQHLGKRATLGNYMDITERKQMERDIQDKKEQLAAQNEELQQKIEEIAKARAYSDGLLSSMSDAFLLLDFDGIVHDANDVYFKMMGYTREEVLGQLMKTAPLTQEGIKTAFERLKKHKAGIQMGNWETTITNNYGEKVTMDVSPNVIRDAQGNPAMLFTVLRDITERKRMEEKLKEYSGNLEKMVEERTKELKDAQADLVRSERLAMLGQFSGSISHELRNPLGVIDSSAYYLKTKLEGIDEKVSLHLDRIKSAAGKANAIIQSILELTRMHDPKLDRLDINAVIAGAIAVSNVPAKVNLMQDYSEPEIWVNGDLEQLLMAFQNIIKNAVEAMEGAGTLKLTVHTTIDGRVEISIGDSGMGIAPENLANIFEPLFSTKAKGIGFGLAITRMVIEKHKGTIEVKSEVGKGTTFIVRLPQSIVEKS